MKRKKSPPSPLILRRLEEASTLEEVEEILIGIRYVGDLKQIAEKYGLHYLISKRTRKRDLLRWILDHHPLARSFQEKQ